jgi:hypothetical protein
MSHLHSFIAAACLGLIACVEAPNAGVVEVYAGCTSLECGNSSEIGNVYTDGLYTDGRINDEGFKVESMTKDGVPYKLVVEGGRISGRPMLFGSTISASQLIGARIWVRHVPSNSRFVIEIEEVSRTPSRTTQVFKLETYLLEVSPLNADGAPINEWKNVCTSPVDNDLTGGTVGMNRFHAFALEADKVDGDSLTVQERDPRWFSFGCAGHALSKLALNAHTYSSAVNGFVTSVEERTAFLKMITADYCGIGKSFTVPGTALDWMDDRGFTKYHSVQPTLEAKWSHEGALCLDTPRLEKVGNPTGDGQFPLPKGVRGAIDATCGEKLPSCDSVDVRPHLVSAHPVQ